MSSKNLLLSTATTVLLMGYAPLSLAQTGPTSVEGEIEAPLTTSALGDITIEAASIVTPDSAAVELGTVTGVNGNLVTLDSDNDVTNNGVIAAENAESNTVGVLISGGNTGDFTQSGTIALLEEFARTDVDGDTILDGPFAAGENRTGILISGASPFIGNVETTAGSIGIEGNDSSGIRLAADTSITGNIINSGTLTIIGADTVGFDVEGAVLGAVSNTGTITSQGEGARAIHIQGDVSEGFTNSGALINSGFSSNIIARQAAAIRDLFDDAETQQAEAAVEINSNIDEGVTFGFGFTDVATLVNVLDADNNIVTDADGANVTQTIVTPTLTSTSAITQVGAAPAILIDGQGTPITIGLVNQVVDTGNEVIQTSQDFGLVQQGVVTANGIIDDSPATAIQLNDVTVEGGILNSGTVTATAFRSADDGTVDVNGFDGHARGLFLSGNANVDTIENQGSIIATATEATDALLDDGGNTLDPRNVQATAIEISADSTVSTLINTGQITASVGARTGATTAIIDRSGTLSDITNQGTINILAVNTGEADTAVIDTTALDLRANTSGVTFLQQSNGLSVPSIAGDIILGSGDDSFTSTSGLILGSLEFGAGADTFTLDNTNFAGALADSDGVLDINVTDNSILSQTSTQAINLTNAAFDSSSIFATAIDGQTGDSGAIIATNNVTFDEGSQVAIVVDSLVVDDQNQIATDPQSFTIVEANNLQLPSDLASLNAVEAPFLYQTSFAEVGETLVVTLDLRDPGQTIADGGLGLDARQEATFFSALQALQSNTELQQAFTAITDGSSFNAAFNQLLPETAAAPLFFIQSGVDGAFGAVGSHLDNARRSQDRTGGAWLQQFTYFADRELDGLSEQFRGFGFGFTGGLDTAWGPFHAIGANIGFASSEVEDVLGVDDPLDIVSYQAGLYAGSEWNDFSLDLYAGAGASDIETNRLVTVGSFNGIANSERNATHINGTARLGYSANISERFWVRPLVSLDYLRLDESAYEETGTQGLALSVDSRVSDRAGISGLLNIGTTIEKNRTWIRPSIRGGYRTDFISDPVLTQFQFLDVASGSGAVLDNSFVETESGQVSDNGFILGFTVAAGSKWSSFSFDFDSDIRDGFIRHTGRVVVRLLF